MPVTSVQGALDAIKNSNSVDGASVFDTLTKVLAKVSTDCTPFLLSLCMRDPGLCDPRFARIGA